MLPRSPFYAVNNDAYLFSRSPSSDDVSQPEEIVRQWCAFELIRAYGYSIADLTFEHPVSVGSKSYRIDILVRRNGAPWIVVECKEPKHRKPKDALAQAISYADAQAIQAEFAISTNGSAWLVSRRVERRWVPVVDIPSSVVAEADGSIDDLLHTLQKVEPILHKLDDRIEGDDARTLLAALQVFFNGSNLLTAAVNRELRFGTDLVLRALSTAAASFEKYRIAASVGYPLPTLMEDEHIGLFMPQLLASMAAMVEGATEAMGIDAHLIRLNIALLDYGGSFTLNKEGFPAITPQINETLRGFLSHAFVTRLGIRLPSSLDALLTSDMKNFCRPAWNTLLKDEREYHAETRRMVGAALLSTLMFWKRRRK